MDNFYYQKIPVPKETEVSIPTYTVPDATCLFDDGSTSSIWRANEPHVKPKATGTINRNNVCNLNHGKFPENVIGIDEALSLNYPEKNAFAYLTATSRNGIDGIDVMRRIPENMVGEKQVDSLRFVEKNTPSPLIATNRNEMNNIDLLRNIPENEVGNDEGDMLRFLKNSTSTRAHERVSNEQHTPIAKYNPILYSSLSASNIKKTLPDGNTDEEPCSPAFEGANHSDFHSINQKKQVVKADEASSCNTSYLLQIITQQSEKILELQEVINKLVEKINYMCDNKTEQPCMNSSIACKKSVSTNTDLSYNDICKFMNQLNELQNSPSEDCARKRLNCTKESEPIIDSTAINQAISLPVSSPSFQNFGRSVERFDNVSDPSPVKSQVLSSGMERILESSPKSKNDVKGTLFYHKVMVNIHQVLKTNEMLGQTDASVDPYHLEKSKKYSQFFHQAIPFSETASNTNFINSVLQTGKSLLSYECQHQRNLPAASSGQRHQDLCDLEDFDLQSDMFSDLNANMRNLKMCNEDVFCESDFSMATNQLLKKYKLND